MTLPGGASDKAGNRYEATWTVVCMSSVLRGEFDSIRLEPPGPEGQGIEFWLRRGNAREFHQVKRRGARSGNWTLRELNDTGVLRAFQSHLTDANATCVFVSMQGADVLRELAERSQSAADYEEFEREFTKGEWGTELSKLVTFWPGCARDEAFSLLKRIRVHTIDEDTLRRLAKLELASLVEGIASAASAVLFKYAFDRVHQELDSAQIRRHLNSEGFNRPVWANPQALTEVVEAANERYLTFLDRELIRGKLIEGDECDRVLASITECAAKRGVILTGGAGAGKSTVLLQVIKTLQQQGVAVLAFRIDWLEPTQRPDEVGQQIGLSAAPVATLAEYAKGRPSVLVLDQLDAVSFTSGRNPLFFYCFDEIVRQALTQPTMRLLVACRRFDFENDHRLRQLGGCDDMFEAIEVGALSETTVRQNVEAMGLAAARLDDHQIRLLSVPSHLKLLADVADESATATLGFRTANDLYDLFWQRKQALLQQRLERPVAWTAVIDTLCEHMNEHQALSVPEAILDAHERDVRAMISEHVLVLDNKRITFFHEGFFDYAFARRFAARGGDLMKILRSGEQHLFRRAQVRQVLLHGREIDLRSYLECLRELLVSREIRFHIKQVVFALLAELDDPTKEEWGILETLLQQPDYPHRSEIWSALRTLPWFRLLDSLGVVANWLEESECDTGDQVVMLLKFIQGGAADRVAELVEPYIGASEEWRKRLRYLVQWTDLNVGRRFFELFLRLIDNGDLDCIGRSREDDALSVLYELAKSRPEWACEAIREILERRMKLALEEGETNPFSDQGGLNYSQSSDDILIGSAQRAPAAFVVHVLPSILLVIERNAVREGEAPWKDIVWQHRQRDGGHDVAEHMLRAAEEALRKLAIEAPDEFARVARRLLESEYETVHFLLIRAYAANGETFANEGIDYLCESRQRLSCGYFFSGSSLCASRELIEAATPFCSSDRLATLEAMLLEYYTDWERRAGGHLSRGLAQFELLLAIDEKRRSALVAGRIGEWRRKFQLESPPGKLVSGAYTVGSPIDNIAAEKMTDDQWLGALARYKKDHAHDRRDGKMVGGARELSRVLETLVRKDPSRFARLVLRFPDEAHIAYFDAVLRGLDSSAGDTKALFEACRRCHRLPKRPAGSWYCRLVEKLDELDWPDDLIEAVAWYATEDPDPDRELWKTEASSGKCYYGGDIYTTGINCVRGAAAHAVRSLLLSDRQRKQRLLPTLERMVRDPSIAVRSCVVAALYPLLNHDRDLALELFMELCDTEHVLLKTRHVEEFMSYATVTHFEQLRPIVERMLCSNDPEVAQAGARRACVASLDLENTTDLEEQCMTGSEPLRSGAAQVFAANVGEARWRSVCEPRLLRLFDDPSEEVRALAAECFNNLEGHTLGGFTVLVERFQSSDAFAANHKHLIRALEATTARLPDVTISVCDRFIEIVGQAAGDMRSRAAGDADRLSELIIRAYHQASDDKVRTRCLDTIDNLLRVGAFRLQRALLKFDR